MYGLSNNENIFDLMWPLKVKSQTLKSRSNPENFEVEYLGNGTR